MTTRRAFLAAAFGAATARALSKPKHDWGHEWRVLQIVKVDYATKTVTFDWRVPATVFIDPRQAQARLDFLSPTLFVPYCKNPRKYGSDLPPDGTHS